MGLSLVLQAAATVALTAPEPPKAPVPRDTIPILYSKASEGSRSLFSPISVLLNKGLDHFQARDSNRDLREFNFNSIRLVVFDAITNPVRAIEHYPGWSKWLRTEILPLGYKKDDARWAVNYSEHMIAGGLTYRKLGQWYAAHGYPAPRLLAGVTTWAASALNEAAEFQTSTRAASSTVADLLVFDLGGIILFSWDAPVRFFTEKLQAADWSTQASIMFPNGQVQNNGQYYIVKVPLPKTKTRFFTRFGMGLQSGFTRVIADHGVSLAAGFDTQYRFVDPITQDERIGTFFSGGMYVDRDNSLLFSLGAGPTNNRVVMNVYPGLMPGVGRDLGFWAAYTRDKTVLLGLVHRRLLGVGAGYAR